MKKIIGCFIESGGKILLLKRNTKEPKNPGCYEVPKGNFEQGETKEEAIVREIKEETGLNIKTEAINDYRKYDFDGNECWACRCVLPEIPAKIILEDHDSYAWLEAKEALTLNLILGLKQVIEEYYKG